MLMKRMTKRLMLALTTALLLTLLMVTGLRRDDPRHGEADDYPDRDKGQR